MFYGNFFFHLVPHNTSDALSDQHKTWRQHAELKLKTTRATQNEPLRWNEQKTEQRKTDIFPIRMISTTTINCAAYGVCRRVEHNNTNNKDDEREFGKSNTLTTVFVSFIEIRRRNRWLFTFPFNASSFAPSIAWAFSCSLDLCAYMNFSNICYNPYDIVQSQFNL